YGITVAEAKIFCKPIVITNFGTAKEHIINGKNGYIVDFNGKELSNAILKIINDSKIENLFIGNLESLAEK
ncbi:glycosyltransferase, partial [Intestinibacter bartlettii]|uniref:glycosyltransferase n=1 Tax=Intestinibacter bartlettii TaxID=261299 RepID=UPI00399F8BDE